MIIRMRLRTPNPSRSNKSMGSQIIEKPTALAVSLVDAKDELAIDGSELDGRVTTWLKGVISYAESETGRAIMQQTWRVTLDAFPVAIGLPRTPVISVVAVKYVDPNGVLQTLDSDDYELDSDSQGACIVPAFGKTWPATCDKVNAVYADVVCGFGADDSATPDDFRLFILAKLKEQFDPEGRLNKENVQSSFIDHLLDAQRVYG